MKLYTYLSWGCMVNVFVLITLCLGISTGTSDTSVLTTSVLTTTKKYNFTYMKM